MYEMTDNRENKHKFNDPQELLNKLFANEDISGYNNVNEVVGSGYPIGTRKVLENGKTEYVGFTNKTATEYLNKLAAKFTNPDDNLVVENNGINIIAFQGLQDTPDGNAVNELIGYISEVNGLEQPEEEDPDFVRPNIETQFAFEGEMNFFLMFDVESSIKFASKERQAESKRLGIALYKKETPVS